MQFRNPKHFHLHLLCYTIENRNCIFSLYPDHGCLNISEDLVVVAVSVPAVSVPAVSVPAVSVPAVSVPAVSVQVNDDVLWV
jgi:hypothetical protein